MTYYKSNLTNRSLGAFASASNEDCFDQAAAFAEQVMPTPLHFAKAKKHGRSWNGMLEAAARKRVGARVEAFRLQCLKEEGLA